MSDHNEPSQEAIDIQNADVTKVACPSCSGPMVFNPEKGSLACEYCDYEKPLAEEGTLSRHDFFAFEKESSHAWGQGIKSLHCKSCGASTHIDSKEISTTCPFCGSKHIVDEQVDMGIKPHAVVPFTISRNDAYDRFTTWIKKRFFAKKAVKNAQDSERLKGVYIPYWHFNVDTSSYYTCQIGYNYTVTVTRTVHENGKAVTKHVQETRIRWVTKNGQIDQLFNDLLSNASQQFNTAKINALEPFDFRQAKPYDSGYLSGFVAERYSVSLNDGFELLKPKIHDELVDSIRRTHHGDHIRSARLNTSYNTVDFQHVLLPVWISTYLFKGKTYQFGINGQTGEVQGTYPINWFRVALLAIIGLALLAAYFIYQEQRGGYSLITPLLQQIIIC